jgi:hypothetical protein
MPLKSLCFIAALMFFLLCFTHPFTLAYDNTKALRAVTSTGGWNTPNKTSFVLAAYRIILSFLQN